MLVGFQAQNHPQQAAKRGPSDTVDERLTPDPVFRALHQEFQFTVDAAANARNAKLDRYWDLQTDGLAQPWVGERVWCNPPYSNLPGWVGKAALEHRLGCELIVMLLPSNRTEQPWWQDLVEPNRDGRGPVETRFLRRRFNFGVPGNEGGKFKSSAPFGCVLLIWRAMTEEHLPIVWLRDLDGTGSYHVCAKGDPGSFPVYDRPGTLSPSHLLGLQVGETGL